MNVKLAAPTLTDTEPASPANNNSPEIRGSAPAGTSLVRLYANAACTATRSRRARRRLRVAGPDRARPRRHDDGVHAKVADNGRGRLATARRRASRTSRTRPRPRHRRISDASRLARQRQRARHPGHGRTGSTVQVYATATCTGSPAAQGSATASRRRPAVTVADNSTTTFYASATDDAGNVSGCSTSSRYVEDSIPPAAPSPTGSDPRLASNDNTPRIVGERRGRQHRDALQERRPAPGPRGQGSAATFASQGIQVDRGRQLDDDVLRHRDRRGGQHSRVLAAGMTYVEDSVAPAPRGPERRTSPRRRRNDNSPRVLGTAPAGATVRLYADAACTGAVAGRARRRRSQSPGLAVRSPTTRPRRSTPGDRCRGQRLGLLAGVGDLRRGLDRASDHDRLRTAEPGTGDGDVHVLLVGAGATFECRIDTGVRGVHLAVHRPRALAAGRTRSTCAPTDSAGNAGASAAGARSRSRSGTTAAARSGPAASTPAQLGCLGIAGTLYVGTNVRNVRTGCPRPTSCSASAATTACAAWPGSTASTAAPARTPLAAPRHRPPVRRHRQRSRRRPGRQRPPQRRERQRPPERRPGNDRSTGGAGRDRLLDRRGKDRLSGGAGNDRIDARDGTLAGRRGIDINPVRQRHRHGARRPPRPGRAGLRAGEARPALAADGGSALRSSAARRGRAARRVRRARYRVAEGSARDAPPGSARQRVRSLVFGSSRRRAGRRSGGR